MRYVVAAFTDKWVIAVKVRGMTGKKKDFPSRALSKVQAFSVGTPGPSTTMPSWTCGVSEAGCGPPEFNGCIGAISRLLATHVL